MMKGKILDIKEEKYNTILSDGRYVITIGNEKYTKTSKLIRLKDTVKSNSKPFDLKVGDDIFFENRSVIERFIERLNRINISVELSGNLPWVYIDKINNKKVIEKYSANHGFCGFFTSIKKLDIRQNTPSVRFSSRKEVFKLIRFYTS